MLEAFIVTLREGVEAALIVGITLAYLSKINRPELRKSVYAALISAFVGSLGVAALLSRTQWNQDIFEGWVMLAAAFFVVTMIIFMMKTGRKLKGEIEGKVGLLAGRNAWFGLFAVRFPDGAAGGRGNRSDPLRSLPEFHRTAQLHGHVARCSCRGCVRRDVRQGQRAHQSAEILPRHHGDFVFRRGATGHLRPARALGKWRASLLQDGDGDHRPDRPQRSVLFRHDSRPGRAHGAVRGQAPRQPERCRPLAAERRKAVWSARRERLWMASVYASSFVFIVLVTAEFIYTKSVSALSPATEVTFVNGQVSIPLAQVQDGDLHRYSAQENGTTVRFWLYQKPDGKIATVLDACEICGAVGFYKGPNGVVCKNCAAPINPQSVGMPGGCNPVPLKAQVTSDAVIIQEADIAARSHMFQQ